MAAHTAAQAAVRDERLARLLEPATAVLLTVECQRGVVGEESALPELAEAARTTGALGNTAALVSAAHSAGVTVIHAVAERRPDGKGASANARLFRAAARLPVQQLSGSPMTELAEEIPVTAADLVSRRLHGLSPLAGTDVDALLRNLGCRTLIVTGVSANVAVPNAVFDAVNLGYEVVVPQDAVAGVPADYTAVMVANTLSLVATITTTGALLACWGAAGAPDPDPDPDPAGPDPRTSTGTSTGTGPGTAGGDRSGDLE